MNRMLKTLCITIFSSILAFPQAGQDSVDLSKLVQQQIQQVQADSKTKPVAPVAATVNEAGIPESLFVIVFAMVEILAGALIVRHYLKSRRKNILQTAGPAIPVPTDKEPRRRMTQAEVAKLRADVTCQLTLIKTQEELNKEAKRLQVGTGELELAIRMQNMGGSN